MTDRAAATPSAAPLATNMSKVSKKKFPFKVYIISLDRKPERYEYVTSQLKELEIKRYKRWPATDGFAISASDMQKEGLTVPFSQRKGFAGCAVSHIRLWRHLAEKKADWTLILEDDVHFHPAFVKLFAFYWKHVPLQAKIVYPGYHSNNGKILNNKTDAILQNGVYCTHAYMLCGESAQYLLDKLLPLREDLDLPIMRHFQHNRNLCYLFNGNFVVNDMCPNDYKKENNKKCDFQGIIYQNREVFGTAIKSLETRFDR